MIQKSEFAYWLHVKACIHKRQQFAPGSVAVRMTTQSRVVRMAAHTA
jgi:hypothetical protein